MSVYLTLDVYSAYLRLHIGELLKSDYLFPNFSSIVCLILIFL